MRPKGKGSSSKVVAYQFCNGLPPRFAFLRSCLVSIFEVAVDALAAAHIRKLALDEEADQFYYRTLANAVAFARGVEVGSRARFAGMPEPPAATAAV